MLESIAKHDSSAPVESTITTLSELFDHIGMNDVLGGIPWLAERMQPAGGVLDDEGDDHHRSLRALRAVVAPELHVAPGKDRPICT